MTSRALAIIVGPMEESILASGSGIKCMARGKSHGLMAGSIMENMLMIKSMDMEFLNGKQHYYIIIIISKERWTTV